MIRVPHKLTLWSDECCKIVGIDSLIPDRIEKEDKMNTVLLRLHDGKDIITKTMQMTDAQINSVIIAYRLVVLEREMKVTSFRLDADPKWILNINFKKASDKDECMSKKEFGQLLSEGWILAD